MFIIEKVSDAVSTPYLYSYYSLHLTIGASAGLRRARVAPGRLPEKHGAGAGDGRRQADSRRVCGAGRAKRGRHGAMCTRPSSFGFIRIPCLIFLSYQFAVCIDTDPLTFSLQKINCGFSHLTCATTLWPSLLSRQTSPVAAPTRSPAPPTTSRSARRRPARPIMPSCWHASFRYVHSVSH